MKPTLFAVLCLAALPVGAETKPAPPPPSAAKPSETPAPDFVRFREDAKGAQLQTAIGTYRNAQGVVVELVGAIHIADGSYYERLNKHFTKCDAVLYEMVGEELEVVRDKPDFTLPLGGRPGKPATPPTPPPAGKAETEKSAAPAKPTTPGDASLADRVNDIEKHLKQITPPQPPTTVKPMPKKPQVAPKVAPADQLQAEDAARQNMAWLHPVYNTLRTTLGLESQMESIDYSKPNFVHADMTARQMAALQQERGEGFVQILMRVVQSEMANPKPGQEVPNLMKILEVLSRPDSSTELKRMLGRMFDQMEKLMSGMESELGSVIVVERNKVALGVLEKELAKGRKHLAIFYGAAHLPDMEKRLLDKGFKQEKLEWVTAWDLPPEAPPAAPAPKAKKS